MLNENIKQLRCAMNISQVELANKLGVSKQCVFNWENDNVLPSIEMLVKIAKFFNVSTDFILDLDDKNTIDVSHLSIEEISHIKMIIKDLQNKK